MVEILDKIIGFASEPAYSDAIHDLGHHDRIETLTISHDDVARHRFRLTTDKGTDCAIMLERDQYLSDGAILKLADERAIVVRLSERKWLSLDAPDKATALELGYFAGNLHWKVRFDDGLIHVALEGPVQTYLDRLDLLLQAGKVSIVGGADD